MLLITEERQKLFSTLLLALVALGTLFIAVLIINEFRRGAYIGAEYSENNILAVEGEGEVFAVPDIATFTFSVQEEAATVAEAQQTVTDEMDSIIEYLQGAGIAENDIRTVGYNVYPRYEWRQAVRGGIVAPEGERVLVGYEVAHTLEVKVRDTADAGALLSEVGSRGVDSISGLEFTIDDEDELVREARQLAIAEAKAKARELARDLGVSLVRISSFSDVTPGQPMFYAKREYDMALGGVMDDAQASTPSIPTGENKILSRVQITYEIK